jgi:serine/threonine-protein kinase
VVAVGPEETDVPDLRGMTVDEAKEAATKAGFTAVEAETQYSDDVEEGKVISQTPSSGGKAKPGSTIELVVSRGSETVSVPNVIGMTEDQAYQTLQDAGFGVNVKARDYSDTQKEGRVMKQDPLYDKVKPGTTISITISLGPEPTTTEPDTSTGTDNSSNTDTSTSTDNDTSSSSGSTDTDTELSTVGTSGTSSTS